jgi:hypothetical protein
MSFGPISLLVPRRACPGDLSRRSFNEDGILNQNPIFEIGSSAMSYKQVAK